MKLTDIFASYVLTTVEYIEWNILMVLKLNLKLTLQKFFQELNESTVKFWSTTFGTLSISDKMAARR